MEVEQRKRERKAPPDVGRVGWNGAYRPEKDCTATPALYCALEMSTWLPWDKAAATTHTENVSEDCMLSVQSKTLNALWHCLIGFLQTMLSQMFFRLDFSFFNKGFHDWPLPTQKHLLLRLFAPTPFPPLCCYFGVQFCCSFHSSWSDPNNQASWDMMTLQLLLARFIHVWLEANKVH